MARSKTTKGKEGSEPGKFDEIITAYSETGQRIIMTKSDWLASLPKLFDDFKDKPGDLYRLIVISLNAICSGYDRWYLSKGGYFIQVMTLMLYQNGLK